MFFCGKIQPTVVCSMDSVLLEYVEQAFDVFQDGIWISDADSTCLFVNKKYEELSGFSRKWMMGRKATSIVAEGIFDVAVNPEVISTARPVSKIQTLSNGRHLSLDGFPIFDKEGKVIMCITFIRDISTIVSMENRLAQQRELLNTIVRLNNSAGLQSGEDGSDFIYSSAMEAFLFKARIMAQTDISILILGETGVGKDVMAQRIHTMSRRADKPFIKVDCGSISPNLIESELFGYIGGAFSGASRGGPLHPRSSRRCLSRSSATAESLLGSPPAAVTASLITKAMSLMQKRASYSNSSGPGPDPPSPSMCRHRGPVFHSGELRLA